MKRIRLLGIAGGMTLLFCFSARVDAGVFSRLTGGGRNAGAARTIAYPNPAPAYVPASYTTSVPLQVTAEVVAQVPDDRKEFVRYRTDGRPLPPNFFNPRELEANIMDVQIYGRTATYLKEKPALASPQSTPQTP